MKSSIKIAVSVLLIGILFSCNQEADPNAYTIKGQVDDYNGYVFLNYTQRLDSTYQVKDSAQVVDGKFEFNGEVPFPIQAYVHLQPPSNVAYIYVEPGTYEMYLSQQSAESPDGLYYYPELDSVVGSYSADLKASFTTFRDSIKNLSTYENLIVEKVKDIIKNNPAHGYSGKLLADFSFVSGYIPGDETEALLASMDTTTMDKFDLELILAKINKDKRYAIGKPVGDISLPGLDNAVVDLDPSKSEYTLVDFWASWCGPCLKKFPDYKEILAGTTRDKFSIYGVSLDDYPANWRAAIQERSLDWTHVIDSIGFESKTAKDYYIIGIPRNFLIDSEGNIVEIDIAASDLRTRFLNP